MSDASTRHAATSPWTILCWALLWGLLGGLTGSAARGLVEWVCAAALHAPLWTARAGINVLGGLGMGWSCATVAVPDHRGERCPELHRHRAAAAFFGGFTTVSGFAWDGASAWLAGEHGRLALLLAANGAIGLAGCALGVRLGRGSGPSGSP